MSDDMPVYTQNELQMSPGDIIEFAVCISNMNGIVDLDSFKWRPCELLRIQSNEKDSLSYNRDLKILERKDRKTKVHCDTNRICEVEDAVVEWITVGPQLRDQPRIPIPTYAYDKWFNVLSVQFNELDLHFDRILLQTKRTGLVKSSVLNSQI